MKTVVFKTTEELITTTEETLRETLATAGNLMLSGGSTPYVVYNKLATSPCPVHLERKIFLSDERMVPADSPKNNFNNLRPMLTALDCEKQFIRVKTELPIESATTTFAEELSSLQTIDLGLLGMGTDGHTAGMFHLEQARKNSGPLTLHTDRPDGMQGISITPALLNRIERCILLVTGESKREIIQTLQNSPETIVAGVALSDHPNVELWTDVKT